MRRYPQVGFSVARRTIRARRPAGMAGRPGSGGLGGPAAGDQLAVPAQDGGRGDEQPEAAADGEQSGEGGDQGAVGPASSAGAACVVGARRVGGAGRGSRCPWWCRIGCAARSSPGAWRTSGRSVAAPSADHAWPPAADERAGHGLCAQFRAPTGSPRVSQFLLIKSRRRPRRRGRPGFLAGWPAQGMGREIWRR